MRIGPIELAVPFAQAGLAGYSDRAMRLVARRRGCPYAVTEALLDIIMLNGGEGLRRSIDINDEDHPIAGQIIGSEPQQMARAAQILHQAGYDVIDLNFACPVKKIKNKARGGHMLKDAERAIGILKAVRDALPPQVPTTVSLRRGFDDAPESLDRFHQIMEATWASGYAAVRVHARTVEQKYVGASRWEFLRALKRQYPDKVLFGSGDLFTAEDAVRMLRETGVDGAWIARGAIGNPWIFRHAAQLLNEISCQLPGSPELSRRVASCQPARSCAEGLPVASEELAVGSWQLAGPGPQSPSPAVGPSSSGTRGEHNRQSAIGDRQSPGSSSLNPEPRTLNPIPPPTIAEQREALAEHFGIAMQVHGEQLAARRMRKMGIKYSRFHPEAAQVKRDFIEIRSLREWQKVLDRWYVTDGPGVWPDPKAADEVNAEAQGCEVA